MDRSEPEALEPARHPFGIGFLQPLGIDLLIIALFVAFQLVAGPHVRDHHYALQVEGAFILALLASLGLWRRYLRQGRRRRAAGVVAGTVVWPIVMGVLFLALVLYALAHAEFVVP
ncbi:MAG TPA: hypothetical protein VF054_02465 [Micromonosporaceae bacterium]